MAAERDLCRGRHGTNEERLVPVDTFDQGQAIFTFHQGSAARKT